MTFDAEELLALGKKYADAKANRRHLEEMKKSLVALLMKDAEKEGAHSAAAQEREALAHDSYLEFLEGLREAVREEAVCWSHWQVKEREFEYFRTQAATARLEAKIGS